MRITIRLLASYRRLMAGPSGTEPGLTRDYVPGTRVEDVLKRLPIPPADAYTFFVNGRHAERDQVLQEGDELVVFPAAGGG